MPGDAATSRHARGGAAHQGFLDVLQTQPSLIRIDSHPLLVGHQPPRSGSVCHAVFDQINQVLNLFRVHNFHQRLDPAIQVTMHQVRGPNPDFRIPIVLKRIDSRMLQESSQDRNDPNVIAEAGDTWLNGTNAANLNHHRNPRLGSPVECVRQAFVHNRVDFEQDFRFLARFLVSNFAVNPLNQAITNGAGRDQQTVERRTRRVSAELVEQTRQVLGNLTVIGQQAQVLVPASSLGVIVAGTNVAVAMQPIGFLTYHQAQLTVRLETDQAVNHVNPSGLPIVSVPKLE